MSLCRQLVCKSRKRSPAVCTQDDVSSHQADTQSTACADLRLKLEPVPPEAEDCFLRIFTASSLHHMHMPHKAPLLQMHFMESFPDKHRTQGLLSSMHHVSWTICQASRLHPFTQLRMLVQQCKCCSCAPLPTGYHVTRCCATLHCAALHFPAQCCAVLCCAVLCSAVLCSSAPCRAVLCRAVPCCAVLYCVAACSAITAQHLCMN